MISKEFFKLKVYRELREKELTEMFAPFLQLTDDYFDLKCYLIEELGQIPPSDKLDEFNRNIIASTFDFFWETRNILIVGKAEVAIPLIRRIYENISLMVACNLGKDVFEKWSSGKEIKNSDIRILLDSHPLGEKGEDLKELYRKFSKDSHSNRVAVPGRRLGNENKFTLGSVGFPMLYSIAEYARDYLSLLFWMMAFAGYLYKEKIPAKEIFVSRYRTISGNYRIVSDWLTQEIKRLNDEAKALGIFRIL